MTFPIERILTSSARDYVESIGKTLNQYELRGIHSDHYFVKGSPTDFRAIAASIPIPEQTEVITDLRVALVYPILQQEEIWKNMSPDLIVNGTALISKK